MTDRLVDSLTAINAALNPRAAFAMVWEYRVLTAVPGPPVVIDCQVVDPETAAVLPQQLVGIKLWPGPSGFVAVPQPGTIARIGFVNGDPSKPSVVGLDPAGTPLLVMGFATLIQLGDQGASPVTPAAWATGTLAALVQLATSLAALATPPGPLTPLGAIGGALETALGALPPPATTKVFAT